MKKSFKQTKHTMYEDPAHGWLKVKKSKLKQLGIEGAISPYSYQRGEHAYLEEDIDMNTYIKACNALCENIVISTKYTDRSSKIRSYEPYKA